MTRLTEEKTANDNSQNMMLNFIIIMIMIIMIMMSHGHLAEHECSANWGDYKSTETM